VRRGISIGLMLLAGFCLSGCFGKSSGPERFGCYGAVTLDGNPVPKGTLSLEPDSQAGNLGPGTGVAVKDGKFKFSREQGHVGGNYIVILSIGTRKSDDPNADPEVPYHSERIKVSLPKSNGTFDMAFTTTGDSVKKL
jgi:hypothetical protein